MTLTPMQKALILAQYQELQGQIRQERTLLAELKEKLEGLKPLSKEWSATVHAITFQEKRVEKIDMQLKVAKIVLGD